MNQTEIRQTLTVLMAAWPHPEWGEDRTVLWSRDMAVMNADDVTAALEVLRQDVHYQPSLSQLHEQVKACRRARELKAAETHGLPSAPPTKDYMRFLKVARAVTATKEGTAKDRGHKHGSGVDCVICSRHDLAAHKRDRRHHEATNKSDLTCVRCVELMKELSA